MSNLDNETRKDNCPCDCWVESCLECTCCRCKDVWTEGTKNTCEGSCEDCACEKCSCEECTCKECCAVWEETVCDPSGECTCEECCCEECTCDEESYDPWEETVCDPSGECTCEECCCEECTCDEECCDPWEETVCDPSRECTCEECDCSAIYYVTLDEYDSSGSKNKSGCSGSCDRNDRSIRIIPNGYVISSTVESFTFTAEVLPCNDESYIEWKSGNAGVATIDRYGKVVPKRDGVAKITASAGGASASCLLYVNSKPLVRVEQHDGYFSATFDGHALGKGRIWRSIGCDLMDPANRSQTKDIYNAEEESSLNPAELRHLRNFEQNFTVEQFNVLYRLDPLGVIFYVKEHARLRCHGLVEQLEYKDSAYLAIFKRSSRFEYKFVDGVVDFRGVSNLPRDQKHTLAEGVFGGYTEWNWNAFWKEFFWSIVEHLPVISQALSAIQLSQALFFADSFGDAASIVLTVLNEADADENKGKRLGKLFGWIEDTFEVISSATQSAYVHPSEYSICIYNSLKECNYRVTMKTGSKIVPMELLIDHSQ